MRNEAVIDLMATFVHAHPVESMRTLEHCTDDEIVQETQWLTTDLMYTVMDNLSPRRASQVFDLLDHDRKQQLVQRAPPWFILKLLNPLTPEEQQDLLGDLPSAARKDIEFLLDFPAESIARVIDNEVDTARIDMTVQEALQQLKTHSIHRNNTIFVVDEDGILRGQVYIGDLALSPDEDSVEKHLQPVPDVMNLASSQTTLLEQLEDTEEVIIPVTDERGKLVGAIHHRALRDVVEADATADLQTMVGVGSTERVHSKISESIKFRLPWLVVNLLTTFVAAAIIALFENLIATFTVLAVLLPVVAGQSGNTGAQSMAIAIRALALKEIGFREWWFLTRREFIVGGMLGTVVAIICGFAVFLWSQSIGLMLIIVLSMLAAMSVSCVVGALVPLGLTRLGFDPATASSIILTTFTDVAGFLLFLGIALLLASMI